MLATLVCWTHLVMLSEGTHIFSLDRDFSKVNSDNELARHVQEVVGRLKTFKVAVHPRIRLFYQLLKRAMSGHAQRTADSLYSPNAYREEAVNIL